MSLWTSLEPASATVDPGSSTTVRLRLRNTATSQMPREALVITDKRLEDLLIENARADLQRLVCDVPPTRIASIRTDFAIAWDGICRAAREEQADLIVIGSHGYHGLDRVLGTTAAKVVNHADRNVLVVRNSL